MSKQEDRAQKLAEWLKHLQAWKASGSSVAAYVREQGLTAWAMYHWRGVLIREGHWHEAPKCKSSAKARGAGPLARFARVAVSDPRPSLPITVRLHLANGRNAEIELMGVEQVASMLIALERQR